MQFNWDPYWYWKQSVFCGFKQNQDLNDYNDVSGMSGCLYPPVIFNSFTDIRDFFSPLTDTKMKIEFWDKIVPNILVKIHGFAVKKKKDILNTLTKGMPLCELLWKFLQQKET